MSLLLPNLNLALFQTIGVVAAQLQVAFGHILHAADQAAKENASVFRVNFSVANVPKLGTSIAVYSLEALMFALSQQHVASKSTSASA